MPKTDGLTDEQVFAAADAVEARGERPTQHNVRDELGGGSFATIGPALRRWRQAREDAADLAEVELPDSVEARGRELLALVWREASARAQAGHAALQAAVADLERAVEEAEAELEKERADRAALDRRFRDLELELAGLRSVADRVEKAEIRADRAEARADKLEVKADQALADLATARADLATARAERASAEERLKRSGSAPS